MMAQHPGRPRCQQSPLALRSRSPLVLLALTALLMLYPPACHVLAEAPHQAAGEAAHSSLQELWQGEERGVRHGGIPGQVLARLRWCQGQGLAADRERLRQCVQDGIGRTGGGTGSSDLSAGLSSDPGAGLSSDPGAGLERASQRPLTWGIPGSRAASRLQVWAALARGAQKRSLRAWLAIQGTQAKGGRGVPRGEAEPGGRSLQNRIPGYAQAVVTQAPAPAPVVWTAASSATTSSSTAGGAAPGVARSPTLWNAATTRAGPPPPGGAEAPGPVSWGSASASTGGGGSTKAPPPRDGNFPTGGTLLGDL